MSLVPPAPEGSEPITICHLVLYVCIKGKIERFALCVRKTFCLKRCEFFF